LSNYNLVAVVLKTHSKKKKKRELTVKRHEKIRKEKRVKKGQRKEKRIKKKGKEK